MDIADTKILRLMQAISQDLSDCYGKPIGLYSESEYYEGEFVHRNTLSPTILKTDGKTAELNVNIRYPYGASEEDIANAFSAWAAPLGGSVTKSYGLHAVFVSQKKPFLKAFAKAYEDVTGIKNEFNVFNKAESIAAKHINNRKGNINLVSSIVSCNFSGSEVKP